LIGIFCAIKLGMTDVLPMLLGALLVSIGVLASAVADRIRQLRSTTTLRSEPRAQRVALAPAPAPVSAESEDSGDVLAALVAAGYKKAVAARAVAACTSREQATPESWTAAALRRCAQGGAS
jgi:Holliday junction resolvasome RuvABC DNA-binding subunit